MIYFKREKVSFKHMQNRIPVIYALARIIDSNEQLSEAIIKTFDRYNLSKTDRKYLLDSLKKLLKHYLLSQAIIHEAFSKFYPNDDETYLMNFELIELNEAYRAKKEVTPILDAIEKTIEINKLNITKKDIEKLKALAQKELEVPKRYTKDPILNNSLVFNCPQYVLSSYIYEFGPKITSSILSSLVKNPNLFLAINTYKTDAEKFKNDARFTFLPSLNSNNSSGGVLLSHATVRANTYPEVLNGELFPIDRSWIQFLDALPQIQYGRYLQVNAATGSLSAYLSIVNKNKQVNITAVYGSDIRFAKGKAFHERLGLADQINELRSSTLMLKTLIDFDAYDVVVVTPTSTHLGQARKRPDTNVVFSTAFLKNCMDKEDEALLESSFFVAKEGYLAYAVPSLLKEEGENRINAFLERRPNFKLVAQKILFPFPMENQPVTDGLYYAILKRVSK